MVAYKLKLVHPSRCPHCRGAKLSHTACPSCGYYKGRLVKGTEKSKQSGG
jgi:large subunit ribosomal protein L32